MNQSFFAFLRLFSRFVFTLVIVAIAAAAGWQLWNYYLEAPWTRDGRVRANVVTVAPDVAGLIDQVLVQDNQTVKRGDVLFRINPARFELAVQQAEALVANRKAQFDEATREQSRYQQLSEASVSRQTQEQKATVAESAAADYRQAVADRDLAKLNLKRSEVTSPVDGIVTNVTLEPGDYVTTGRGVMALIDSSTLRVEGYFEETKLPRIQIGDKVEVRLMGESRTLTGRVASIAAGIADRERTDSADLLASVNPTFSWVRLAQRVPVRVKLEAVPADMNLVLGRTATVSVVKGDEQSMGGISGLFRETTFVHALSAAESLFSRPETTGSKEGPSGR
ncbi:MAG: HlyD family secretion protein [Beijerinckiaceae bacterium]|nr:HlyD family secretion protein [Beijerinckiaceae bacterium]